MTVSQGRSVINSLQRVACVHTKCTCAPKQGLKACVGCYFRLFHLTSLIPVSPHSGDRVELRTAAERGIEANSGSLSLLLSQSPSIIGALEIFTHLSSLHFSFLFFPMPPGMHSSPLEASLRWQFFDQRYSYQLPTTAWLTTSDLPILQASSLVPSCSWSYFFPSFTVGCTEPSCPLWYPLFLHCLYHSDPADVLQTDESPANVFPGPSCSA